MTDFLAHVHKYWQSKFNPIRRVALGLPRISEIKPLYQTMREPCDSEVGHLIDFECGHTGKPSELEAVSLKAHLDAAGFITKKIVGRSQEISANNTI